jgi:hypothetical protein
VRARDLAREEIADSILIAQESIGLRALFLVSNLHVRPPTSIIFHLLRVCVLL